MVDTTNMQSRRVSGIVSNLDMNRDRLRRISSVSQIRNNWLLPRRLSCARHHMHINGGIRHSCVNGGNICTHAITGHERRWPSPQPVSRRNTLQPDISEFKSCDIWGEESDDEHIPYSGLFFYPSSDEE
jgi:hypothetical protein